MAPSLYHGEYEPLKGEFVAVGVFGILLFSAVFTLASFSLFVSSKKEMYTTFYISLLLMCIFDLPRYFMIAIYEVYDSAAGYAMHIISSILFFLCLAIVCFTFANMLELGPYTKLIYSKVGLAIAIALHSIIDIVAFAYCLSSSSLAAFFASTMYRVYVVFDILQNIIYSSFLVFYGLRLIYRFRNMGRFSSSENHRQAFYAILKRVTFMLTSVTVFSLMRLVLLSVKLYSIQNMHNDERITTPSFSLYGFLWFTFSDFLPRGGSGIALSLLMQSPHSATSSTQKSDTDLLGHSTSSSTGGAGETRSLWARITAATGFSVVSTASPGSIRGQNRGSVSSSGDVGSRDHAGEERAKVSAFERVMHMLMRRPSATKDTSDGPSKTVGERALKAGRGHGKATTSSGVLRGGVNVGGRGGGLDVRKDLEVIKETNNEEEEEEEDGVRGGIAGDDSASDDHDSSHEDRKSSTAKPKESGTAARSPVDTIIATTATEDASNELLHVLETVEHPFGADVSNPMTDRSVASASQQTKAKNNKSEDSSQGETSSRSARSRTRSRSGSGGDKLRLVGNPLY